jgi:hypothetical protein
MDVIREFKRPLSSRVILDIPDRFVRKDLEILVIPIDRERKLAPRKNNKEKLFEKLCGLWEDRMDLNIESIRAKAWKRT